MSSSSFMICDKLREVSTTVSEFSEFNIGILPKRVYSNKIREIL